jgi:hypothetical protein
MLVTMTVLKDAVTTLVSDFSARKYVCKYVCVCIYRLQTYTCMHNLFLKSYESGYTCMLVTMTVLKDAVTTHVTDSVCMHTSACVCVHTSACVCVHISADVRACVCACICTCVTYTCTCTYGIKSGISPSMRTRVHTDTQTHIYT